MVSLAFVEAAGLDTPGLSLCRGFCAGFCAGAAAGALVGGLPVTGAFRFFAFGSSGFLASLVARGG